MKEYLLHKDIFMPQQVKDATKNMQKSLVANSFSSHLYDHLLNKDRKHNYTEEDINKAVEKMTKNPIEPFEVKLVEANWGKLRIVKYCVRMNLNDTTDIVIVIGNKQNVVTAWLNNKNDTHRTLDRNKYYRGSN